MKKLLTFITLCLISGYLFYIIGFIDSSSQTLSHNVAEMLIIIGFSLFISWNGWYPQPNKDVFIRDDTKKCTVEELISGTNDHLTTLYVDCAILSSNIYKLDKRQATYEDVRNDKKDHRFKTDWSELENLKIDKVGNIKGSKLGVEIWQNEKNKYIAIVFRGTVKGLNSWIANLHWLYRFLPIKDQYDEIKKLIPEIICNIEKIDNGYTIITTGHSLGGGLAQHANYLHETIKYSFVFNSSPVTGWSDINSNDREKNTKGSRIYRLYERGEILQFLRFFMKIGYLFSPRPNQNPYFVEHRLNLTKTGVISSHNMDDLAYGLQIIKDTKIT